MLLVSIVLESSTNIRHDRNRRLKTKLSLFVKDVFIFLENTKTLIEKLFT